MNTVYMMALRTVSTVSGLMRVREQLRCFPFECRLNMPAHAGVKQPLHKSKPNWTSYQERALFL